MIFKEYFLILLSIHVLGDFYFQSSYMAEKKVLSIKWVMIHSVYYWAAAIIISLPVISWDIILLGMLAALFHMIIDILKYLGISRFKDKITFSEAGIFFVDQAMHIICLIFLAYIFTVKTGKMSLCSGIAYFFTVTGIQGDVVVSWVTALLIIHKPANILISKMLSSYKPDDKDRNIEQDNNAGRFIGTVERLIILIFISIDQYAAIGLVLTAKSIARYDKIVSKPAFAEYYLLGTLLSTVTAVIASFAL